MIDENADKIDERTDTVAKTNMEDGPKLNLYVSSDHMMAELEIIKKSSEQKISYDEVIAYLHSMNVSYGIVQGMIRLTISGDKLQERFTVARGKAPIKGEDSQIQYHYEKDRELKPKENEDGSVDFHNLDFVINVSRGDVLAEKVPAKEGVDGVDIHSNQVHAQPGRDYQFPQGSNTYVSEDGLRLLAEIDGCLEMKNNRISVKNIFTINGDVDTSIGNIDVAGTLIINGDVREGFTIHAKGDVVVHGLVEGASIEAGGNVNITHGMNGMNKGIIKAEGNINCKYIESGSLYCGGDLTCESLITSTVEAGGSIISKGINARILGGQYQAGKVIYSKDIGNDKFVRTELVLVSKKIKDTAQEAVIDQEKLSHYKQMLEESEQELQKVDMLIDNIKMNDRMPNREDILQAAVVKKRKILKSIAQHKEEILALFEVEDEEDTTDLSVIVTGIIYPGTRVQIGKEVMKIEREYKYTKFAIRDRFLTPSIITPADKII